MKNVFKFNLFLVLILSVPAFALDGVYVLDMRMALERTQATADAYKALQEDADFSANLEQFQTLQTELQAIVEKLQKEQETLSAEEIAELQKDYATKGKDLEFLQGKLQQAQAETFQSVVNETGPTMQKIIGELINAKEIKVLLQKNDNILFSDPALDLTDDVTSMLDVAASEANTQSE